MPKKLKLILAILIAVFLSYNLLGQIFNTLKQQNKLEQATERLYELEMQNKQLKKKLTEVKSQNFIEQLARDKLGLAKEGETVVIIPDEKLKTALGTKEEVKSVRLPNWQGWLTLFWP